MTRELTERGAQHGGVGGAEPGEAKPPPCDGRDADGLHSARRLKLATSEPQNEWNVDGNVTFNPYYDAPIKKGFGKQIDDDKKKKKFSSTADPSGSATTPKAETGDARRSKQAKRGRQLDFQR